jgi:hypothetical protein
LFLGYWLATFVLLNHLEENIADALARQASDHIQVVTDLFFNLSTLRSVPAEINYYIYIKDLYVLLSRKYRSSPVVELYLTFYQHTLVTPVNQLHHLSHARASSTKTNGETDSLVLVRMDLAIYLYGQTV